MSEPNIIKAPFTTDQVLALNAYQTAGVGHPFTCGECGNILVAIPTGWVCSHFACTYTQDWAHEFMAGPGWRQMVPWTVEAQKEVNLVRGSLKRRLAEIDPKRVAGLQRALGEFLTAVEGGSSTAEDLRAIAQKHRDLVVVRPTEIEVEITDAPIVREIL